MAFTAWRKRLPDVGEELAEVVLCLPALAGMNGIEFDAEIERKITKNAKRVYQRDTHGTMRRISDQDPA